MSVDRIEVVAVVNHLGERMLINREDYLRGQWELWQEELEGKAESNDGGEVHRDPSKRLSKVNSLGGTSRRRVLRN